MICYHQNVFKRTLGVTKVNGKGNCRFGGVANWRGVAMRGIREKVFSMVSWREK